MSAKNENVAVADGETWVRLTDSAATVVSITLSNTGASEMIVMGTTGSTPVAGTEDGVRFFPGDGIANMTMADLFPGVTATQVWARSIAKAGDMFVSHAA